MISLLIEKGVLTREDLRKEKSYDRLKRIRKHPKRVEILDKETGTITEYRSIYSAAKAFNQNPGFIAMFNGKVYKKRYEIKVCESDVEESTSSDEKDLIDFTTSEEEISSSDESASVTSSDESTSVTSSDESTSVTSSDEISSSDESTSVTSSDEISSSSEEESTRAEAVTRVTAAVMKVQAAVRRAAAAWKRKI